MADDQNQRLIFDLTENYLEAIKASIGSEMFKTCWFKDKDGLKADVCLLGRYSCAFYVSRILKWFDFVRRVVVTVDSLEQELRACHWRVTKGGILMPGSVLMWASELSETDGKMHRHVGFFWRMNAAISINPDTGMPVVHHITFGAKQRRIEKIYFHPLLLETIAQHKGCGCDVCPDVVKKCPCN